MTFKIDAHTNQGTTTRLETDQESPFNIDELFFSRTDERGVIQAFNDVFARIAEYPDDALRGAPHKLIRHPDMPKAVFWLIWDTLKSGKPISGYVKNRAKSGKFYWVYALILPVSGGYLSVRMKPTSPTLGTVQTLYKTILQQERDSKLSPEQSAEFLLLELRALGFDDYAGFQAHAIVAEFQARERHLKRAPFPALTNALQVAETQRMICDRIDSILTELAQGAIYTLNMKLQATKLGRDRAAIDAIANNYDLILADIKNGITRLQTLMSDAAETNFRKSKESQILLCAASIMSEVVNSFAETDDQITSAEKDRESGYLGGLKQAYVTQSTDAVSAMVKECRQILGRMGTLRQMLLALSAVRVSLRVETYRLGAKAKGLESLIADIDQSQFKIQQDLEDVFQTASQLQNAVKDA
ncbi:PAS domain-containing protein [Marivita sp.]|uniref:PAS domain-containing protein n=1 Tax=Marivita sp. TaxID=2003365 RepID=UPI003F6B929B